MHHIIDIYIHIFLCVYIYIRTSTQVLKVALHCRIWWFAIPSWRSAGSSGSAVAAVCGGAVVVAVVEFVPMVIGYMVPSFHWIRFNDQT